MQVDRAREAQAAAQTRAQAQAQAQAQAEAQRRNAEGGRRPESSRGGQPTPTS
jgi:hypothetical protein